MTLLPTLLILAHVAASSSAIDFDDLLSEMVDLKSLARLPELDCRTIQFSSTDRRSSNPEAPGWYANSDGFGREAQPGFEAVLERPDAEGVGTYLLADVEGPGAIVRGWSAGMDGTLRVVLDGDDEPLFEGRAYDFLADRTRVFLERAGLEVETGDAFRQEDADYLPMPFARSLRVTWRGKIDDLHFYELEVRRYSPEVVVQSFDPGRDLGDGQRLAAIADALTQGQAPSAAERQELTARLGPDATWEWTTDPAGGSRAIVELSLRLRAADLETALRGTLLRIAFDGASRPQIESPVGDFSATAPGVHPFSSLPMSLSPDGTVTCRFVMPFQRQAMIQLWNSTDQEVEANATVALIPWDWDERSLYFHAKWRSDAHLDTRFGAQDLPFIVLVGQGHLVGVASIVTNPGDVPHPYGSWWGEGDEKIFVDGEQQPSFLGTGSEDFYNYSWSRPNLFSHPYCGQPQNTGPGNQGYCTNHRWLVLDSVPFARSLSFHMELWLHNAKPGLGYARLAYVYARPGAVDDHRRVQASELVVPDLPPQEVEAEFGARGATFRHLDPETLTVDGGRITRQTEWPTADRGELVGWTAQPGDRLHIPLQIAGDGEVRINLVAAHRPDGGIVSVTLDGAPLTIENLGGAELGTTGANELTLRSRHARRLLSTGFAPRSLLAGEHVLTIECAEAGDFGFDYLWLR